MRSAGASTRRRGRQFTEHSRTPKQLESRDVPSESGVRQGEAGRDVAVGNEHRQIDGVTHTGHSGGGVGDGQKRWHRRTGSGSQQRVVRCGVGVSTPRFTTQIGVSTNRRGAVSSRKRVYTSS